MSSVKKNNKQRFNTHTYHYLRKARSNVLYVWPLGMLHSSETITAVYESLSRLYPHPSSRPILVIDPVMISTSGHHLLQPTAIQSLIQLLLPIAKIVTPNIEEAILISGWKEKHQTISNLDEMKACARAIFEITGTPNILIKGGHFLTYESLIIDLLYESEPDSFHLFRHPFVWWMLYIYLFPSLHSHHHLTLHFSTARLLLGGSIPVILMVPDAHSRLPWR